MILGVADAEENPARESVRMRPGAACQVTPVTPADSDDEDREGHGRRNGHDPHACQDEERGHCPYSLSRLSLPGGMATTRYSTGPKYRTAT